MDIELALRAARRQAAALGWQQRDGLSGLAAIAHTAALVGFLGTLAGIFAALHPRAHGRYYVLYAADAVADGFIWNLFGLAVAMVASVGFRLLEERCPVLDIEMELTLADLPAWLRRLGGTPILEHQPGPRGFAERAANRARRTTVSSFGQPLSGLRTIIVTVPFVGLLGTCWWIAAHTFKGVSGPPSNGMFYVGNGVSEALLFTAFGLLLALGATCSHRLLEHWRDELDREMFLAMREILPLAR